MTPQDVVIPTLRRDECINMQMVLECDEHPTGLAWPPPASRPADSRLVSGILAYSEGGECEGVVADNECVESLAQDTCESCPSFTSCASCFWQCSPWCNDESQSMAVDVRDSSDIDMRCWGTYEMSDRCV